MFLVFSNLYINSSFFNLSVYCQYLIISSHKKFDFLINLQLYAKRTLVDFIGDILLPFFPSALSKPVMDVLVTLCASYHLNPSDYTVELLSANKNNINFKPNSPIGSLEAEKIVLKPKGVEEKIRRPYMPEVRAVTCKSVSIKVTIALTNGIY